MSIAEDEFVIDPLYEDIAAPKFFDFHSVESSDEVARIEAWFDEAPANPMSPQVVNARASGRSLAPLNVASPVLGTRPTTEIGEEIIKPVNDEFTFDAQPAASTATPGITHSQKQRIHPMTTRSLAAEDAPPSALRRKDLYYDLCSQAFTEPNALANNVGHAPAQREQKQKLTVPKSPKFASTGRPSRRVPLPKEQATVVQEDKRRKLEDGKLKQILNPRGPVYPARSTAPLTVPKEFRFTTADRKQAQTRTEDNPEAYVSFREAVEKFQRKTPKRFHSVSGSQKNCPVLERFDLPLTVPSEPNLATAWRARPVHTLSHEDQEAEAFAKTPKFKARPIDPKVFESAKPHAAGLVSRLPLTEVQEFHFETAQRAQQRGKKDLPSSLDEMKENQQPQLVDIEKWTGELTVPVEPHLETSHRARPTNAKSREDAEVERIASAPKFKARPVNRKVMESLGEIGVPRVPKRPLTEPMNPVLLTSERASMRQTRSQAKKATAAGGVKAVEDPALRWEASLTLPQEFQLQTEERGKAKQHVWQERAQKLQGGPAAHVLKARPLPPSTEHPHAVKKPAAAPPTQPEPFHMPGMDRHLAEQQKLAAKRQSAQQLMAQSAVFKAKPNLSKLIPAFVPDRSRRPLTRIEDVQLNVDRRAGKRAKFDTQVQKKHLEQEQTRLQAEADAKAAEERAVKELRKEMVPHARPMPLFDRPFVPCRSTTAPTLPLSPALGNRTTETEIKYQLRSRLV